MAVETLNTTETAAPAAAGVALVPEAEKVEATPAVVCEKDESPESPETLKIAKSGSFKEESNVAGELPDPQKKALDELKQLVQEALNKHEFSAPPPPAPEEKNPATEEEKPATEEEAPTVVDEDAKACDETAGKDESTPPRATAVPEPEKVTEQPAVPEPATEATPEEVSIWGIPLLLDERSDVVLLKFLRARDFKVKDAFTMLKNVVTWRKQFGIESLLQEDLGTEQEQVVYMHGVDTEGHPVCYNAYGEYQNKKLYDETFSTDEKRTKFLRWRIQFLENSIRKLDFNPDGVCTIVQVIDFKNSPGPFKWELRQATNQALQLFQDNYPEFVAKQVLKIELDIELVYWV